jgi:hypothetical protein
MEPNKISMFHQMIDDLILQYHDNSYCLQRLETHLANLPSSLEIEHKKNIERIEKQSELTNELEKFCKIFLLNNQYFYNAYNESFYEYDGKYYKLINADEIHHKLLSTITNEEKLLQWKYKSKNFILKKIKERWLFYSTPETFTIQNVISFFLTYFKNKTEIKYFLTVLGDCLLKKNHSNLFFVSTNFKKCIAFMDSILYSHMGPSLSLTSHFTTKYHDMHTITNYRILNTRETDIDIVKNILLDMGLDIFCVASHYSERYGDSENYLTNKKDELENVNYFVNFTVEDIVNDFIKQSIEFTTSDHTISWKNMHFIWKSYLTSINVPNMLYANDLLTLLKTKLPGTVENKNTTFTHVTSKYLPKVRAFLAFWEKYIVEDIYEEGYEMDELLALFKQKEKKITLSETEMLRLIQYYGFSSISIENNKYVTNIRCSLWDKQQDVSNFLDWFQQNVDLIDDIISFDELYNGYKKQNKTKNTMNVSKQYFEKIVNKKCSSFVQDRFLNADWMKK